MINLLNKSLISKNTNFQAQNKVTFFTALLCIFISFSAGAQVNYNYYYGNLHSHSGFSDGNQDSVSTRISMPIDDYAFANASQHFDFLGISEHNHQTAGMLLRNYSKGLGQAQSYTREGEFVALYGMEWGVIQNGGHILIYGVDKLIGWEPGNYDIYNEKYTYRTLFKTVNKFPGAFMQFAHPASKDYNGIFSDTATFNPSADSALVGVPMRSGPATSTNVTYTDPDDGSYESVYRTMLAKGYHVGMSLDHDNHKTTFGRTTPGRLVVLAESLTRNNIMGALRARRFFGSDDWNAKIDFRLNTMPMGSITYGNDPAVITVNASDDDGESFRNITIMRGVPGSGTQATSVANGNGASLSYTDPINNREIHYYYAVILQADGDRIVTSPVWYDRVPVGTQNTISENLNFNVFPNPSAGSLNISYFLPEPTAVSLDITDMEGRLVHSIYTNAKQDGGQSISLDNKLAAGLYVVRLLSGTTVTHKTVAVTE
ncbi:MAG: T9SS type A sorting domain-containing protein [Bacteroidota bacterium]